MRISFPWWKSSVDMSTLRWSRTNLSHELVKINENLFCLIKQIVAYSLMYKTPRFFFLILNKLIQLTSSVNCRPNCLWSGWMENNFVLQSTGKSIGFSGLIRRRSIRRWRVRNDIGKYCLASLNIHKELLCEVKSSRRLNHTRLLHSMVLLERLGSMEDVPPLEWDRYHMVVMHFEKLDLFYS